MLYDARSIIEGCSSSPHAQCSPFFEEAKHFSQLLLSRYVNIVEIGGALAPITITDISSEISDADNATNSIKFKYKYSSHHFPINIDYGKNIFDDPFHLTFD